MDKIIIDKSELKNNYADSIVNYVISNWSFSGIGIDNLNDSVIDDFVFCNDFVSSAIKSRLLSNQMKEWTIRSVTGNEEQAKKIELLTSNLNMVNVIRDFIYARFYARTFNEIIWNDDFSINKIVRVPKRYFNYDNTNKTWKTTSTINNENSVLSDLKWVVCINEGSFDYPGGRSELEALYKLLIMKEDVENGEMNVIKKYANIIPYFAFDSQLPADVISEQAKAIQELNSSETDQVIALPTDVLSDVGGAKEAFGFITLDQLKTEIHENLLNRIERTVNNVILGGNTSNNTGTGSYAEAKVQYQVRDDIVEADEKFFRDSYQQVINVLGVLHNFDGKDFYISLDTKEDESKNEEIKTKKADNLTKVYQMGYDIDAELIEKELGYEQKYLVKRENIIQFEEFAEKGNVFKKKRKNKTLTDNFYNNYIVNSKKIVKEMYKSYIEQIKNIESYDDILNISSNLPTDFEKTILISKLQARVDVDDINNISIEEFAETVNPFELSDQEAIKYFTDKNAELYNSIDSINDQVLAETFFIKKTIDLEVVKKVQKGLIKTLEKGLTLEDFKMDAAKILGLGEDSFYYETVFRTNIQSSYAASRYLRQKEISDVFELWLYDAIDDGRTSDICLELNGKVYDANNSFWDFYYPPNHYNCRSSVIALTKLEAEAEGFEVEASTPKKVKEIDIGNFKGNPAKFSESFNNLIKEKEKQIKKNQEELNKI